jgi:hypothetical protein
MPLFNHDDSPSAAIGQPVRAVTRLIPLVVLALVACGGDGDGAPGEPPPPAPDAIDAADSGKTFELAVGAETSLRLSSEYSWEEPVLSGDTVELSPVDYLQDPGFTEWLVRAVRPGDAVISSEGTPACAGQHGCPDEPIEFRVTITVAE